MANKQVVDIEKPVDSKKRFLEVILIVITLLAALKAPNNQTFGDNLTSSVLLFLLFTILYYIGLSDGWAYNGVYWGPIVRFLVAVSFASIIAVAIGSTNAASINNIDMGVVIALIYYLTLTGIIFKALTITYEGDEHMKKGNTTISKKIKEFIKTSIASIKTWFRTWGIFLFGLTVLYIVGFFALVTPNAPSAPITQNEYTLAIGTGILSAFMVIMFQRTVLRQ